MTEGAMKPEPAADAVATLAASLAADAPAAPYDDSHHKFALGEIASARADRDAAVAERDATAAKFAETALLAVQLRKLVAQQYAEVVEAANLFDDKSDAPPAPRRPARPPRPPGAGAPRRAPRPRGRAAGRRPGAGGARGAGAVPAAPVRPRPARRGAHRRAGQAPD